MIVEFDETGRIFHMVHDPVPQETEAAMLRRPFTLSFPPLRGDDGVQPVECDLLLDYVAGNKIERRPACPASVAVSGRVITIEALPAGSTVAAIIEDIEIPVAEPVIEMDEAGPVTLAIIPPWPYLEARHDLEIE